MNKFIKIFLFIFLIISIVVMIIYKRDEASEIKGTVIYSFVNKDTNQTQLVMLDEQQKQVYIVLDNGTSIFSWFEHPNKNDVLNGNFKNIRVSVLYNENPKNITTDDGIKIKVYNAKVITIDAVFTENVTRLSNGTWIDMWDLSSQKIFCLKNGAELLCETNHLDFVSTNGGDLISSLNPKAQQNINIFFSEKIPLYNLNTELENAYNLYKMRDENKDYSTAILSQNIYQSYSNEKIVYFITEVVKSFSYQESTIINKGYSFNKETGELIPNNELFCVPEEVAIKTILDLSKIKDTILLKEMETAFNFDNIILSEPAIQISFPAGSLPSQKTSNTIYIGIEYSDLKNILYDWAIPKQT